MFCMSLLQTFRQSFEFKRLKSFEKIKIADISIILEHSQKDFLTAINKNLWILAQTRSYFSILIFCTPI